MSVFKLVLGVVIDLAIFGGLLFVPAWTLDWPRAWVFVAAVLVGAICTVVYLYRVNPEVLKTRWASPIQKGQPLADKIIVSVLIAGFCGILIVAALDVNRFHWLPKPGTVVSSLGLVLFAAGWWLMTMAMKENTFAAPAVRLQVETHQKVIDTGAYRIVRHPMYSGSIIYMLGMGLWLESYAAVLLAILPIAAGVARILFEERFLRQKLEGYDDYTRRIRYRLVPFLW